jgi:hypothetical protein
MAARTYDAIVVGGTCVTEETFPGFTVSTAASATILRAGRRRFIGR